jgi:transcription elongation regulator 1
VDSLLSSLPATKLGFNKRDVEHEFERWQRERNTEARKAFDEMMGENSFVEFWGRLGKIGGAGVDSTIQNDDIGEEENEDGERVDMKKLAKAVDVKEILKVLKVCSAVLAFPTSSNSLSSRTTNDTSFSITSQSRGRGGLG